MAILSVAYLPIVYFLSFLILGPAVVLSLDNPAVGKVPALGWNSWNAFACDITEDAFMTAANKLVELGLKVRNIRHQRSFHSERTLCWKLFTIYTS